MKKHYKHYLRLLRLFCNNISFLAVTQKDNMLTNLHIHLYILIFSIFHHIYFCRDTPAILHICFIFVIFCVVKITMKIKIETRIDYVFFIFMILFKRPGFHYEQNNKHYIILMPKRKMTYFVNMKSNEI